MTRSPNRFLPALRTLIVATVVGLAAGACSPTSADDTVVLGALYPVSGRQGPGGVDEARGAALAVDLANERGGVGGAPVRLDVVDVDTADGAPAAMERFHDRGVDVVVGSYGSTISAPAARAAHRLGMLLWETGAVGEVGADAGAGTSFFRLAPMGANLGRAAVAFVRDQLSPLLEAGEPLRYAVAYVDDAYGRAVGLGAAREAEASGQSLAGVFPYDLRGLDAAALVRDIANAQPDVLFVSAYLDDGIAIREATVDQHVPLRATIGTSSSYCMPSFGATLGAAAVGLFASDKPDAAQLRADALSPAAAEELRWARERYRGLHGEDMSAAALAGFANTWALVGHVLPAARDLSPGAVAATARGLRLDPGSLPNGAGLDLAGPELPDAGENRGAVSVIWQWVAERTRAVVWPPAYATESLRLIPILQ